MKRTYHPILLWLCCVLTVSTLAQKRGYPITPVPFSSVSIQDNFRAPKIKINHEGTIAIAYEQSQKTGRINNFQIAGLYEVEIE